MVDKTEIPLSNISNLTHLRQMTEEETKKHNIISGYAGPHKLNSEILSRSTAISFRVFKA